MCKKGFTLIELMVVISIVAIVTMVAIPSMVSWQKNQQLTSTSRDVLSLMNAARTSAIKERKDVVILFDENNDSYDAFVNNGTTNWTLDPGEKIIKKGSAAPGIDLIAANFSGNSRIRFDRRGIPEPTSGGTVSFKTTKDAYQRVQVYPTGNSKIQKSSDGSTWD